MPSHPKHSSKDADRKHHRSDKTSSSSRTHKSQDLLSSKATASLPVRTSSRAKETERVLRYIERVVNSLDKDWSPSLNDAALENLKVRHTGLSLSSSATSFIRSVSPDRMSAWIERGDILGAVGDGDGPCKYDVDTWDSARTIANNLLEYAACPASIKSDHGLISLMQTTGWQTRFPRPVISGHGLRGTFDVNWIIDPADKTLPHVTAAVASSLPLKDAEVTPVELICILQLIFNRLHDPTHANQLVPVTLVSISDYHCRVLCAQLHTAEDCLHLQSSRVLHFDYDGYCKSEDWTRLLCWMLAKPAGDTSL